MSTGRNKPDLERIKAQWTNSAAKIRKGTQNFLLAAFSPLRCLLYCKKRKAKGKTSKVTVGEFDLPLREDDGKTIHTTHLRLIKENNHETDSCLTGSRKRSTRKTDRESNEDVLGNRQRANCTENHTETREKKNLLSDSLP